MEGGLKMETQLENIANVWPTIKDVFSVPHTESEYNSLVTLLDNLIDEVGGNEKHPLASLMETIGNLIDSYEDSNYQTRHGTPIETLSFLMKEHDIKQTDLAEVGSQGVVSEILTGKRHLNIRQIKELSSRFNVSPLVFIQDH